jgi:hypothetical protein
MFAIAAATCLACAMPLIGTGTISAGVGYLVDTELCACAASCILLTFATSHRYAFGQIFLNIIIIQAFIAIAEFILKTRLIPYDYDYGYQIGAFRSAALFSHPLELGLFCATAVPFVYLTPWSTARKACSIVILIGGTLAAGARAASIVAGGALLVAFLVRSKSGPEAWKVRTMALMGLLAFLPCAWFVIDAIGLSERFEQSTLFDESAMARIVVLQVFDLLDLQELWWGAGLATLNKLAIQGLSLDYIENSIVMYVFQFGIIGSALLVGSLLYAFFSLGRGAERLVKVGLFVFLLIALSSNALSAKTSALSMIFLLAIAFRSSATNVYRPPRRAFALRLQGGHRSITGYSEA